MTHLADELEKNLHMMQQGFARSSGELQWKPQLKANSTAVALAKARGRPRSCHFRCVLLMRTAVPRGLSGGSTPCSSDFQCWGPVHLLRGSRLAECRVSVPQWQTSSAGDQSLGTSPSKSKDRPAVGSCTCFGNQNRFLGAPSEFVRWVQQG